MWEDATPKPPRQQAERPMGKPVKSGQEGEGNLILWAQLFLCGLILAGVYAAKTMELPVMTTLRSAFSVAMQAQGPQFFSEERGLLKFTQQTAGMLQDAAQEVFGELRQSAPPEQSLHARPARRQPQPAPVGSSLESYLPDFSLLFPLADHNCGWNSDYGWRQDPFDANASDFHTGIDLAASQGAEVYTAADGVVRVAGTHKSYGNYIRILHQNGDETLYAHMQYLFVRPGQSVRAGQLLGTAGQTGNVTGPHLHFELLHEGVRYDPKQALLQAS